jgi:hypothetical protein
VECNVQLCANALYCVLTICHRPAPQQHAVTWPKAPTVDMQWVLLAWKAVDCLVVLRTVVWLQECCGVVYMCEATRGPQS